jgi:hypothetical protein
VTIGVDETGDGTARSLEIVDRDGRRTLIHFRATLRTEMLDGLAPGELSST